MSAEKDAPGYEGRVLAASLAETGIETTLCTDAALGEMVGGRTAAVDAVLVGADAVTPHWFLNKCGTGAAVGAAELSGVPVYVAAGRHAFIGGSFAPFLGQRHGPGTEVWRTKAAGVHVANPYFEQVPVDLVTLFVTDVGAVGAGSVADLCEASVGEAGARQLLSLQPIRLGLLSGSQRSDTLQYECYIIIFTD